MPRAEYQPIPIKAPTGGVNNRQAPEELPDNQCQDARNIDIRFTDRVLSDFGSVRLLETLLSNEARVLASRSTNVYVQDGGTVKALTVGSGGVY